MRRKKKWRNGWKKTIEEEKEKRHGFR